MTEKPKRRRRAPMPAAMRERAQASARTVAGQYTAPEVEVTPAGIRSPYVSADEAHWWRLVSEAFGTRVTSVIEVFMRQVGALVGTHWNEDSQAWMPDPADISAALAIVAAMKPKTEAEAAQAAQAFALHLVTMKVGAGIAKTGRVDPRQANAMANLVKSYTGVMDSLKDRRASRSSRQTIIVKKSVSIQNDNRSVTLPGGGGNIADQPDANGSTTRARPCGECGADCCTCGDARSPALLGHDKGAEALSFPCGEGAQDLSYARRPKDNRT